MTNITINHHKKKVKLVVKNTYDEFPYELIIAIIDLIKNDVLNEFEKDVLVMLARMNDEQLEDTRMKISNLLYNVEVQGRD